MSERTASILGSTGMIGSYLLEQLLKDDSFDYVRILVRRPTNFTHEKLEVKLVNFDDLESVKLALDGSDIVFSCIGTTNKNVGGDKKLYWKIDHDIPVNACRLAQETGCEKFIMVSSLGANREASNFYLKLKGQTEQDVIATGMPEIHIMRPGMLLGERHEKRPMEKTLQSLTRMFSKLLFGSARRFKAIQGMDVAKAMITAGKKNKKGIHIYQYDQLMEMAGS